MKRYYRDLYRYRQRGDYLMDRDKYAYTIDVLYEGVRLCTLNQHLEGGAYSLIKEGETEPRYTYVNLSSAKTGVELMRDWA